VATHESWLEAVAHVLHIECMNSPPGSVPLSILMKGSRLSFFTRRVLQRWSRGEITTDTAVELIQSDEAERLIHAWTNIRA
jgi:hypothetical protein